ncbi:hypothetical protein [Helicobacter sp. 23-1045]
MDFLRKILDSANARVEREKARISFNEMRRDAEAIYKAQIAESTTQKHKFRRISPHKIFHKLTAQTAYLDIRKNSANLQISH